MIGSDARNPSHLWVFGVLFAGLVSTLILFIGLSFPEQGINPRTEGDPELNRNSTMLARDMEFLKGQMNVLITGAMESKIQQLEISLQNGIVSSTDLTTVKELKEDLKALKAYSLQNASTTFSLLGNSGNLRAESYPDASLYSDELLRQISTMKNLFFVSIASWGVAIVIFGATWLRGYYRFRQIRTERPVPPQLLGKPKPGLY